MPVHASVPRIQHVILVFLVTQARAYDLVRSKLESDEVAGERKRLAYQAVLDRIKRTTIQQQPLRVVFLFRAQHAGGKHVASHRMLRQLARVAEHH